MIETPAIRPGENIGFVSASCGFEFIYDLFNKRVKFLNSYMTHLINKKYDLIYFNLFKINSSIRVIHK